MDVSIKSFDVEMNVKNKGIELQVHAPDGTFLGDLVVTKTNLIWCKGKTKRANGVPVTWKKFIDWMESDD